MKKSGILLIALGILIVFLAFNMNVVVGETYHIDLSNERQSVIYLSGALFLLGIMLFGFGFVAKEETKNIKIFVLWTFLTPIILLISIRLVTDIQEFNHQKEIRLQIVKKHEAILKENSDKFVRSNDGTVTLKTKGLMWQHCSVGQTWTWITCEGNAQEFTFDDAMKLTSNFAGYSDWRLPTIDELRTLVFCWDGETKTLTKDATGMLCEGSEISPTINLTLFPNTPSFRFWSASPYDVYHSSWMVNFDNSYSIGIGKNNSGHVRLVRSVAATAF